MAPGLAPAKAPAHGARELAPVREPAPVPEPAPAQARVVLVGTRVPGRGGQGDREVILEGRGPTAARLPVPELPRDASQDLARPSPGGLMIGRRRRHRGAGRFASTQAPNTVTS